MCDAIAFRDSTVTVAARRSADEELVRKDLAAAPRDRIANAFGVGVVTSFAVVAGDEAVAVLHQELVDVGLQATVAPSRHAQGLIRGDRHDGESAASR
jgi:hypothetical protein